MSQEIERQRNRVYIHESVMPIYRSLTRNTSSNGSSIEPEQSPFTTYRDLFLLSLCYGYNSQVPRQPLPNGQKTEIRTEVFGEEGLAIFKSIAIATTNDVAILQSMNEILTLVEEFAHIGIQSVKSQLEERAGQPLWNIIERLQNI